MYTDCIIVVKEEFFVLIYVVKQWIGVSIGFCLWNGLPAHALATCKHTTARPTAYNGHMIITKIDRIRHPSSKA